MSLLVKKSAVREHLSGYNVGSGVYEELDARAREVLDRAAQRTEDNGRSTVKARDV